MKGLIIYDYLSVFKKLLNKSILISVSFSLFLGIFILQEPLATLLINGYMLSLISYIPMAFFENNTESGSFLRTLSFPLSIKQIVLSRYFTALLYLGIYSLLFGIGIVGAIIVNGSFKVYFYPYIISIFVGILILSLGLIGNFSNKTQVINLYIVLAFVFILYLFLSNFQVENILLSLKILPNYSYILGGIITYFSILIGSYLISTKLLNHKLKNK